MNEDEPGQRELRKTTTRAPAAQIVAAWVQALVAKSPRQANHPTQPWAGGPTPPA